MATISRTGITGGSTIQPTHVTNIIDALDGTSTTTTVVATGSFSGSLVGELTGTSSVAISSSVALNSAAVNVTNNTTGTGPYNIAFVDISNFNPNTFTSTSELVRVDSTGLTYNATSNTITATASYATNALSASYAANVPVTASYALTTLSSSYAVTASFALNAGGGTGVGFPFTGSAQVTGSMGITGSLNVTAGVTASLQGTASFAVSSSRAVTASFADTADQLLVQRTVTEATFYPVISDSANAQPTAERLKSTTGITINPGTNVIAGATLSGSVGLSGSFTVQDKFANVDLSFIAGDGSGTGEFILPLTQTNASPPSAGSMFWDDVGGYLWIYSGTNAAWKRVQLTS